MGSRRINTALWTAAAVSAVGGVAVLTWAALAPLAGAGAASSEVKRATLGRDERGVVPPIDSFDGALQARLRRPSLPGVHEIASRFGALSATSFGHHAQRLEAVSIVPRDAGETLDYRIIRMRRLRVGDDLLELRIDRRGGEAPLPGDVLGVCHGREGGSSISSGAGSRPR